LFNARQFEAAVLNAQRPSARLTDVCTKGVGTPCSWFIFDFGSRSQRRRDSTSTPLVSRVDANTVEGRERHPWLVSGPAFARRLSKITNVRVLAR
jgi:hypothetical protein